MQFFYAFFKTPVFLIDYMFNTLYKKYSTVNILLLC